MKRVILLSLSILLISSAYSFAEVPCKINYQGRLIKDNVPVDGTKTMVFSIYPDAVGDSPIWTSGNVGVEVHNGLFRYVLDLSSIDDWSAGQALYLEVEVETEILTPREELSAYPYAINSHLLEGEAKEYFLNTSADTQTKLGDLNIGGNLSVGGFQFEHKGYDFLLGTDDGREKGNKESQRALVHGNNDKLLINYNTDFEGGVEIQPSVYILPTGNVGIGTTDPGAKLHIDGTPGTDGIMFPDETVQTTAAVGFGSWTNKDSQNNTLVVNAVYKAECDGFVCGAAYGASHGMGSIEGFTDGSNPPTTRRVGNGSGYVDVNWSGITMPVKKNDYWKVTTYNMKTPSISWIPIGSGSCVKQ